MIKNGKFQAAMVSHMTQWVDHPAISIACRCRCRRKRQRWRCICRARAGLCAGAQVQGLRFLRRTWIPLDPTGCGHEDLMDLGVLAMCRGCSLLPCLTLVYFSRGMYYPAIFECSCTYIWKKNPSRYRLLWSQIWEGQDTTSTLPSYGHIHPRMTTELGPMVQDILAANCDQFRSKPWKDQWVLGFNQSHKKYKILVISSSHPKYGYRTEIFEP